MSQLGTFFHGTDTRLGVFYPEHSLIAIFPDLGHAAAAKGKLRGAGFSDDEVLATSGADLAELVREESARNGPLGYLIKKLSRFLHTEAIYTDRDLMVDATGHDDISRRERLRRGGGDDETDGRQNEGEPGSTGDQVLRHVWTLHGNVKLKQHQRC